jgi:hypothetical protein
MKRLLAAGKFRILIALVALLVGIALLLPGRRSIPGRLVGTESFQPWFGRPWVIKVFQTETSAPESVAALRQGGCVDGLTESPLYDGAFFESAGKQIAVRRGRFQGFTHPYDSPPDPLNDVNAPGSTIKVIEEVPDNPSFWERLRTWLHL